MLKMNKRKQKLSTKIKMDNGRMKDEVENYLGKKILYQPNSNDNDEDDEDNIRCYL